MQEKIEEDVLLEQMETTQGNIQQLSYDEKLSYLASYTKQEAASIRLALKGRKEDIQNLMQNSAGRKNLRGNAKSVSRSPVMEL